MTGPMTFRFLNVPGTVRTAADWNDPGRERLWLYHLHYFDDLNAGGACARGAWHRESIARWIVDNPPGQGNGWDPYPVSLRVVNWLRWWLDGNTLEAEWVHSLALQVRWLEDRLEWHLLGNHLLANAKALVFAGACFSGVEADRWLHRGLAVLESELAEQILGDGGHFERSPMYHAVVLADLLDLVNLSRAFPERIPPPEVGCWTELVRAMRRWLAGMVHPDGGIGFFNDAAFGMAAERGALESYAERLGLGAISAPTEMVTTFADSGYIRVQTETMVALLDVAPVGPDYLPGHAHADTLSFELSLFGVRTIVNGGTSLYGSGAERQRQRGTAAHSTVTVDGEDSSEVWSAFRVARRARPLGLEVREERGTAQVKCSHDGYRRLRGRPVHRREWTFRDRQIDVSDRVEGSFGRALARFHLHPEVGIEAQRYEGSLRLPAARTVAWTTPIGEPTVCDDTWHPEFGRSLPSRCLEVELAHRQSVLRLSWG